MPDDKDRGPSWRDRGPALAWLAFAAGLAALSWPFWAGQPYREPWPLFLYLFLGWTVMIAGLVLWSRALAQDTTQAEDDPAGADGRGV